MVAEKGWNTLCFVTDGDGNEVSFTVRSFTLGRGDWQMAKDDIPADVYEILNAGPRTVLGRHDLCGWFVGKPNGGGGYELVWSELPARFES